ncbi:glycosyltransferase [Alloiococcus sp. CFN-8]|uniref:glycosyltransferase n=1 Tax=Alloiococcus sp. CFN-8 TaxID=3416081 RepID=UPI003CEF382F
MRILIISRSPWDETNSLGNTLSNLFSSVQKENLANLYFRSAKPSNKICMKYFSITDSEVLKSVAIRNLDIGTYFEMDINDDKNNTISQKQVQSDEQIYSYFRRKKSKYALLLQEILWDYGKWNSLKLNKFLEDFQPEIIFAPAFSTSYTHRILWYVKEKTNAKIALFHADDYMSISKNSNLLNRLYEKKRIKSVTKSTLMADINYCISVKQQEEYQKKIGKEMKLLYKGADFSVKPFYRAPSKESPIKIIYIGSILYGRWKTLSLLAKAIQRINCETRHFELSIYSQYEPTKQMEEQMIINGDTKFMGKIPASKIKDAYRKSDIVLHLESFEDIEKQKTRLSFSTKIVDCLNSGRAVMAIGWEDAASIDYLIKNDAALIANCENKIYDLLQKIKTNNDILEEYANKAWNCGKRNHQINEIQKKLYQDLKLMIDEDKNENHTN